VLFMASDAHLAYVHLCPFCVVSTRYLAGAMLGIEPAIKILDDESNELQLEVRASPGTFYLISPHRHQHSSRYPVLDIGI
jgi:hypothetical protein